MALPLPVQVSLVQVQFETIHPFLDGNGRNLLRKIISKTDDCLVYLTVVNFRKPWK